MSSSYLTKALRNTFLHYTISWYLFLIAFAIIIFPLKKTTYSFELKLIWKYSKKDQISGYKIFCREEGQNYNYSSPFLEVTDPNFTTCSISGLKNNTTYCFISRAYDIFNKESFNSNEVCYPLKECTVYEDAEDGNIDGWIVNDQDPYGASINNVFDTNRQSRVIELVGITKDFIYLFQDVDWNKWDNSDQFVACWSMQYSQYFIVYFDVNTTAGDKYLYYTDVDYDRLGDSLFIHHGLGSGATDGQWHSFWRDLQADLEEALPGVSILQINGFMVYGSGRVDDIKLCNAFSTDTNDIPVNTSPIADNQYITVDEDTAIDITLTASDAELDPLTYTIVTQPIHGTLSGTAPNLTYLPDADYNGSDMSTFKANDGQEDSNIATISITIDPVNDPPITNDQEFFTDEDVTIKKTLTASDVDGDELIFTIVSNGSKGNALITNPSNGAFTYTPDINVHGMDTFGFKVNDGTTDSEMITATINIISVNDAPVAEDQSLNTDKNESISIFLTGTDADGDILTYTLPTHPIHGTLSGTAPNLIYTPNLNYTGSDSFCFKVNDGTVDSNMATVSITIESLVDDPLKECKGYENAEDGNIDGWIIYDQDPSDASINNVFDMNRQSRVIELVGISKNFIYLLQDVDWNKWDKSGQFVARWSMQYSQYFIIYFDVNTTAGDKYLYYTAVDHDRLGDSRFIHHGLGSGATDGQWHSFERDLQADLEEAQPGVCILQINGFIVYGSGRVDDIKLCNAFSKDTKDIPVNTSPIADNQYITVDEDTAIDITLTASDAELDPLTYTIVTHPIHGTLSGTAPNLIYTPNLNYTGSDSLCFKVNDGIADSNMATVSITIDPLLDDPLKECTVYEDAEDGNIDGWIVNDQDPSGASINNVFDTNRQSRVIELVGITKDFIYLLQDVDWNKWDKSGQFVARWSMQYSQYFIIYFDVNTTAGDKYLYYTDVDYDRLGDSRFIHHGLGSGATDGQWHSFERDLQADLEEAQPGVCILQINGFMVYGSGRVDDIKLCNTLRTDTNNTSRKQR